MNRRCVLLESRTTRTLRCGVLQCARGSARSWASESGVSSSSSSSRLLLGYEAARVADMVVFLLSEVSGCVLVA